MKKICLISTEQHNIGDDFVREGICSLLRELLGGFEKRIVHKHFSASVRGSFWRGVDRLSRGLPDRFAWRKRACELVDLLPLNQKQDMVLDSDLVVQCGAPVYWKNKYSKCSQNEWFEPLVNRRWTLLRGRVPLLNLGAGACQAWGGQATEVAEDPECRSYIKQFTRWSSLTTVRDVLAKKIVQLCGHEVSLLPCPSIFAPGATGNGPRKPEYVALNYMPSAGHYDLDGQGLSLARQWEETFCREVRLLSSRRPCLIVCHDMKEKALALKLFPDIPRFYSPNWRDYLNVYSRCHYAVVNRVHGAVVCAAMGKPVLLTGNDTRLLTAKEIPGISVLPLVDAVNDFREHLSELEQRPSALDVHSLIENARLHYLNLLSHALPDL